MTKSERESRFISSVKGSTHLGLACDLLQASHAYTKDASLTAKIIKAQQDLLDIAEAFRRAK